MTVAAVASAKSIHSISATAWAGLRPAPTYVTELHQAFPGGKGPGDRDRGRDGGRHDSSHLTLRLASGPCAVYVAAFHRWMLADNCGEFKENICCYRDDIVQGEAKGGLGGGRPGTRPSRRPQCIPRASLTPARTTARPAANSPRLRVGKSQAERASGSFRAATVRFLPVSLAW